MTIISHTTRSGIVESRHHGAIAITRRGKTVFTAGDVDRLVFPRSTLKAMQILPLLEDGLDEKWDISDEELAVMASSHDGSPYHVEVVSRLLERLGFEVAALQCGSVPPFDRHQADALLSTGTALSPLHNDCSGKHAALLLQAREAHVPIETYLNPDNAVHRRIGALLAELAELAPASLRAGVDGCSAPAFALPIRGLAHAYERFVSLNDDSARARGCRRLRHAVSSYPIAYAGEHRLSTALLQALPDRIFPKNGAEGVFAFGLPELELGVAIKVEDGQDRGYFPVVVALLEHLGLLGESDERLAAFRAPAIRTNRDGIIGHVVSAVEWAFDD